MCVLYLQEGKSVNHIMLQCGFDNEMWEQTAETLRIPVNMARNDNIWSRINHKTSLGSIFFAAICWNL